jgi:hypothetical protein
VQDCIYANPDEMVRDRIVFAIQSRKVREKLINKGAELTLENAIEMARTYEFSQAQLQYMAKPEETDSVHAIQKQRKKPQQRFGANSSRQQQRFGANPSQHTGASRLTGQHANWKSTGQAKACGNCGRAHGRQEECPARGKQCFKCHRLNHFSRYCHSSYTRESIHQVYGECVDPDEDLFIDAVGTEIAPVSYDSDSEFTIDVCMDDEKQFPDEAFTRLAVGEDKHSILFKIDSGAKVNTLPTNVFKSIMPPVKLVETRARVTGYSGALLKVRGKCTLTCSHKGQTLPLNFCVIDTPAPPLLGLRSSLRLNLLELVSHVATEKGSHDKSTKPLLETLETDPVLKDFKGIFQGIGLFPGEHTIRTDDSVPPVIHAPRRIPVSLRDKLKDELKRMEMQDIITKVDEPTDWVSSLVVVEKPRTGKLRVCLDPRDLNKAIKREHYQMPTLEDVISKLATAKYFSVLDARSGYWAVKLDKDSSMLTTFNTPFGRYRFLRLPFGVHSAQEVFQKKVHETYEGLSNVDAIVDDILVYGSSVEEHDANLRAMLQRSQDRGIRLNPDKCTIRVTSVPFFGCILTADGLKPDPAKLTAIKDMPTPQNKGELETVLGMVNYLARFAPRLAEITSPLRDMLKQDIEFLWDSPQQQSFEKMKEVITSPPVLQYFDITKETTIQVDASQNGLGATLLQEGKPIAFASKSLTMTERQYAQIEKECYAIVFGCERFHQYVYGRRVLVESDHKPLESILRKPLASAPARLQRMMLRLQKYDIVVKHKPGKDIPVADTLSRLFLSNAAETDTIMSDFDYHVHAVMSHMPVSDRKFEQIKFNTHKDDQLMVLKEVILKGWPEKRNKCPHTVLNFWNFRDEMSYTNGIILKGSKLVIPKSMQQEMLKIIHTGHMGIEKCQQRARELLFWPGMNADIAKVVSQCGTCIAQRPANAKEPLMPHKIPTIPWHKVGTDLFDFEGDTYLLIADYQSRYIEVEKLRNTRSCTVICKTKAIFARHGIPQEVVSDNGPQYSSQEYQRFSEAWDFRHITSSPLFPQSNGFAEKAVGTIKNLFAKARRDGSDPYLSLLEYRSTPTQGLPSPAELLMSRRLRSTLPLTEGALLPKVMQPTMLQKAVNQRKQRQKLYYDRGAKALKPLKPGQFIHMQRHGEWRPAVVSRETEWPRSYIVQTEDGGVYRRNRRHLLDTQETQQETQKSQQDVEGGSTPYKESVAEPSVPQQSVAKQSVPSPVPTTPDKGHQLCVRQEKLAERPLQFSNGAVPVVTRSGRVSKPRQILDL